MSFIGKGTSSVLYTSIIHTFTNPGESPSLPRLPCPSEQ